MANKSQIGVSTLTFPFTGIREIPLGKVMRDFRLQIVVTRSVVKYIDDGPFPIKGVLGTEDSSAYVPFITPPMPEGQAEVEKLRQVIQNGCVRYPDLEPGELVWDRNSYYHVVSKTVPDGEWMDSDSKWEWYLSAYKDQQLFKGLVMDTCHTLARFGEHEAIASSDNRFLAQCDALAVNEIPVIMHIQPSRTTWPLGKPGRYLNRHAYNEVMDAYRGKGRLKELCLAIRTLPNVESFIFEFDPVYTMIFGTEWMMDLLRGLESDLLRK